MTFIITLELDSLNIYETFIITLVSHLFHIVAFVNTLVLYIIYFGYL